MALTQRLQMRQSQALVMTPQLMQAIKLLQLSNLDLAAYVDKEVESNPLLERAEGAEVESPGATPQEHPGSSVNGWSEGSAGDGSAASAVPVDNSIDDSAAADPDAVFSRQNADFGSRMPDWSGVGASPRQNSDYNLEAFVSADTTLSDHLAEQL